MSFVFLDEVWGPKTPITAQQPPAPAPAQQTARVHTGSRPLGRPGHTRAHHQPAAPRPQASRVSTVIPPARVAPRPVVQAPPAPRPEQVYAAGSPGEYPSSQVEMLPEMGRRRKHRWLSRESWNLLFLVLLVIAILVLLQMSNSLNKILVLQNMKQQFGL